MKMLRCIFITIVFQFIFFRIIAQTSYIVNLANYDLNFRESNRTLIINKGTTTSRIPGTAAGSVHRYDNLVVIGNIHLSAYLTIEEVSNANITLFDDDSSSPDRFQPRIGSSNALGGYVVYKLNYFDALTKLPVYAYNYYITCIDIDGNGLNNREYDEFGGFSSYTVNNPTGLTITTNNLTGRTKFLGLTKSLPDISFDNTATVIANLTDPTNSVSFCLGQTGNNTERFYSVQLGPGGGNFTTPIIVNNPMPLATDDYGIKINSVSGGVSVPNVLNNDMYDGSPITLLNATISLTSAASNPGVVLNTSTGTVTVDAGTPSGIYTLVYKVTMKNFPTKSDEATVSLKVNTPPALTDFPKTGMEDMDISFSSIDFSSKFNDIDDDIISMIKIVTLPMNGTLKLGGTTINVGQEIVLSSLGNITFTPSLNWNGTTSFDWNANDGMVYSGAAAKVNISCTPVNDAPCFVKGPDQIINEDAGAQSVDTWAKSLSSGPADESSQTLSFALSNTNPGLFSVQPTIDPSGKLTYTPAPNANGSATVSVILSDNGGTANGGVDASVAQSFTITVNPVNDAPVAKALPVTTPEDTPIKGLVTATDLDGDALTFTKTSEPVYGIAVVYPDGTFDYSPNKDYNGNDSFAVTVSDGRGGTSSVTVAITVTPVNDAPIVSDISKSGQEDMNISFTATDFTNMFYDIDENELSKIQIVTLPDNGILKANGLVINAGQEITLASLGTITFIPALNWNGFTSFAWNGNDGTVYAASNALVNLTISGVNDNPVAAALPVTTPEDLSVNGSVTATDPDGDSLTFSKTTSPIHGSAIVHTDGTFTYTPNASYVGNDNFRVTVSDGNGGTNTITVSVTVTPVNHVPVACDDNTESTRENIPLNGNVSINDITSKDGNNLWSIKTNPGNGIVIVNSDGTYIYTPNANFYGKDKFRYAICDRDGDTSEANVTISVIAMPQVIKTSGIPKRRNDGKFSWVYTITLINNTNRKIDSIQVTDNLDEVFIPKGCSYEITGKVASGKLIAYGLYNGTTITNLLVNGGSLEINSRDSIQIEVLVDTHGQKNAVSVFNQADINGKDNLGNFNFKSDADISTIVADPTETVIPAVELFIPDGFSPNGDGINDNFEITHPISLKIELEVYNRWGNIVYKSPDYQNNWDGRGMDNLFGQELPAGTYYCMFKAINISSGQEVSSGVKSITLRR